MPPVSLIPVANCTRYGVVDIGGKFGGKFATDVVDTGGVP